MGLRTGSQLGRGGSVNRFVTATIVAPPFPSVADLAARLSLQRLVTGHQVIQLDNGIRYRYNGPSSVFAEFSTVTVTGAGYLADNQDYSFAGYFNGQPYYANLSTVIFWSGPDGTQPTSHEEVTPNSWWIGAHYSSNQDVARPGLVTLWDGLADPPAPDVLTESGTVTQGELDAGITVTDAGVEQVNSVYKLDGQENGKNHYAIPSDATVEFYWEDTYQIYISDVGIYYSGQFVAFPWQITTWGMGTGTEPFPTVVRNDVASELNWSVVA